VDVETVATTLTLAEQVRRGWAAWRRKEVT